MPYPLTPEGVARSRARCARWAAENRGCTGRQPWLLGAPPYGDFIPGGACTIDISPAPRWPIALRNTRHLHGVLSHLINEPHEQVPQFSLLPWESGWAVWLRTPSALRIAETRERVVNVFRATHRMRFGPIARIKSPRVTRRGRQRVRVDAITPVAIRSTGDGQRSFRTSPEASHFTSSLALHLAPKIGVSTTKDEVCVELLERCTQAETVDIGGHWGAERGWVGHVVLEVNAVARWLLEAAARGPGLGARTALGFGRVRVTEVPR